jgi:plasmid stability protein
MTTLQIRKMPQPLYEQLVQRATQFHRSLTQQAIADLSQALGSDVKAQRLATLRKIRAAHAGQPLANPASPELLANWLREDRDR